MTIEELNETVARGEIGELIRVAEARQCKVLSKIADDICGRPNVRLVCVAGGSAAGKTTTAKRLVTQLRVNGRAALHLSTDDYFVGDARNPRDANGEMDYEHVDCVDIVRLVADILALGRGEAVPVRRFDFEKHEPYMTDRMLSLPADGFVVLEGIHALNPRLTEGIAPESVFRVFVEPQPELCVCGEERLRSEDARFLRRMVRDNQFRKLPPSETLRLWPKVLAGEKRWIEPFKAAVDVTFNSYLVYELAVLKPYVGGLLERVRVEVGPKPEIVWLIRLLTCVVATFPDVVPGDSIVRETIGGSQLEY